MLYDYLDLDITLCAFFIVTPYILIYVEFTHQQMHFY